MISYEKFWKTIENKHITSYQLIKEYGFDNRLLDRLRNNKDIKVSTINNICNKLNIKPDEIIDYKKDETE